MVEDEEQAGIRNDTVHVVPDPEPATGPERTRRDPPWPRATANDQTAASLY